MPISNVTLAKIRITAPKTFGIYCARNVQLVDAQIITPAGITNLACYNAAIALTNTEPAIGSMSSRRLTPIASANR